MAHVRLTTPAQCDPKQIWVFIAKVNIAAARRFNRQIRQKMRDLVEFPELGRPRPELAANPRGPVFGDHLIFYRVAPYGIEVVRVLHGSRDIDAVFQGP